MWSYTLDASICSVEHCLLKVKRYDSMEDEEKKGRRPQSYLSLTLHNSTISSDALALIVHHIRRQAGLQTEEKTRLRHVVFAMLPKLLHFKPAANSDTLDPLDGSSGELSLIHSVGFLVI